MLAKHRPLTENGEHERETGALRQRDRVPIAAMPSRFRFEALDLLVDAAVDEGAGFRAVRTRAHAAISDSSAIGRRTGDPATSKTGRPDRWRTNSATGPGTRCPAALRWPLTITITSAFTARAALT